MERHGKGMAIKMTDKMWGSARVLMALLLGICLGWAGLGGTGIKAQAEEQPQEQSLMMIDAQTLSMGKGTYDIQVTVTNPGPDWEGTVRLLAGENYRVASAYDTAISLPQGSTKQFVVKVPKGNMDVSESMASVVLLDKKSRVEASRDFQRIFTDDSYSLEMGILSDSYTDLTYLDMGGEALYFYGENRPIRLVELTQENLGENLDRLTLLVIDNYHTDVLTQDQLESIEDWNRDGGIVIIGTGAYGKETLGGLEDSYLGVEYIGSADYAQAALTSSYLDNEKLTVAALRDVQGNYMEDWYTGGLVCSMGDGAVEVTSYSLTELGKADESVFQDSRSAFVSNLLENVSGAANSRYMVNNANYDYSSMMTRMMRSVGSMDNQLHFGILKVVVVLYVIFAGPVLYLILRFLKKRELYWVAVPASAIAGIFLVFLAGRGFEIVSTKVYSVTLEDVSGREESRSYLYCYDASHREWDLKLDGRFDYIGSYENDNYSTAGWEEGAYYYHMKMEGEALRFGIKPTGNFEDSFFVAGGPARKDAMDGSIVCDGLGKNFMGGIGTTITNGTDRDFSYFAIMTGDSLFVYEDLKAGETADLALKQPVYSDQMVGARGYTRGFLYDYMDDLYDDEELEKIGAAAALGVGFGSVQSQMGQDSVAIIGVTEDWEKTVDDDCSEVSYGCLYAIQ